jgi:DNA-binding transcriptional MerR regulator
MGNTSDKIFQDALANFTHTVASLGAITHLADLGYTPQEIKTMLDFPTPYERIQETFWKHLVEKRIIVEEKSDLAKRKENVHFVTDQDAYGRKSFRKVVEFEENELPPADFDTFRQVTYDPARQGSFADFLKDRCDADSYVSCDFGLRRDSYMEPLTEKQRLYMEGVPWKRKIVWHQLDPRMMSIIITLKEQSSYHGTILLLRDKEQISF